MVVATMSNSLRSTLDSLADSFAAAVLDALRGARLDELLSEARGGRSPRARRASGPRTSAPPAPTARTARKARGRLARRSAGDIEKALDRVRGLLRGKKAGLRSEQIRAALGLDRRELPRILKSGLEKKRLRSKGEKRATTYFAVRPGKP